MKTAMGSKQTVQRNWVVFDLKDKVLGRAATTIASVLRGKHKPIFTPHADCGDFVVVVNADKVRLTGKKWQDKKYIHHTRSPPGYCVWWMYFLSCHFFPVSRTLSAFTTTTKSPQSAWGVKMGLCLPRRTLAMVVAARPSTLSFRSKTTQLRWTVCLLPIAVFMRPFSPKGGVVYWIWGSVSTFGPLGILPKKGDYSPPSRCLRSASRRSLMRASSPDSLGS